MSIEDALGIRGAQHRAKDEHWIPLADVMTGLMMMFMLVALIFMSNVQDVAKAYYDDKNSLYEDLAREFRDDLPKWGATLTPDLAIQFHEPNVLFDRGKDVLKPRFARILDNFLPRYVKILYQPKYRNTIEEIRIEGHTSTQWLGSVSVDDAYFHNMELSQSRTRTTLQYVLGRPASQDQRVWLRTRLTANGLSSSRLIHRKDGSEDSEASQRVEFRVRTNAEEKIKELAGMLSVPAP